MTKPARVLLVLMKLDIGGAETHAVCLARHLKDMGYQLVIVSNGGFFEKEIAGLSIKHYTAPLHRPKLSFLCRSFLILNKVISEEKIDLIHAHARIPAFVSSIIARQKGVHFITTAHTNFKYQYGLKYISQWGEKTIAVSQDIKDHLIRYFGLPEEKIVVIPNGIDLDFFNPSVDLKNKVLQLKNVTNITYVSRLDKDLAPVAINLIKACAQVHETFPELRLNIIGDGDYKKEVELQARKSNACKKLEVINFLGARNDVNQIMTASDLIVGVSRVALEAMACAKPVLLAGSQGFGGLVKINNVEQFQKDNFTARLTYEKPTIENLVKSLKDFFQLPLSWRIDTGKFLRKLVEVNYSSLNMAVKTAQVYQEVLQKRMG